MSVTLPKSRRAAARASSGGHPGRDLLLGLVGEMESDLLVELPLPPVPAEERAQPEVDLPPHDRASLYSAGRSTRAMAIESASQRDCCTVRRSRPSGVRR